MSASIVLAESRNENGTLVIDVGLDDQGSLRVGWFDFGPMAEAQRGGDVERDIRVSSTDIPHFCLALMTDAFGDDFHALDKVRSLCTRYDIPFTETSWN